MERIVRADTAVLLWLNGWVGRLEWVDVAARFIVNDYLVPAVLALLLLGMWVAPRDRNTRTHYQRAVLTSLTGMGLANLAVLTINQLVVRARPFLEQEIELLFYRPTDSSFPANPVVVGCALALGIWTGNRLLGAIALGLALLWGLARVYAGVSYPSDVLAGAFIGAGVAGLVMLTLRRVEPARTFVLRIAQRIHLA
jgi:undecaprenyl-diphosphatase